MVTLLHRPAFRLFVCSFVTDGVPPCGWVRQHVLHDGLGWYDGCDHWLLVHADRDLGEGYVTMGVGVAVLTSGSARCEFDRAASSLVHRAVVALAVWIHYKGKSTFSGIPATFLLEVRASSPSCCAASVGCRCCPSPSLHRRAFWFCVWCFRCDFPPMVFPGHSAQRHGHRPGMSRVLVVVVMPLLLLVTAVRLRGSCGHFC